MPANMQIVIDTDPGVDDVIAILLALASDASDILGLTVVGGNVPQARGARNALAVLQWVGREGVPVCRGSSRPLSGRFQYSVPFHGASGITRRLPNPRSGGSTESAVGFLRRQLQEHPGEVSLVALGPLTNLASLVPAISGDLENPLASAGSLTIMGGAVETPGNVTSYSEFNFHSDPLAAHRVLNCGVPATLVDLADCRQVAITREQCNSMRGGNVYGRLAIEILKGWFEKDTNRESFQFYDPLALAVALNPGLVATRQLSLSVDFHDPERWGECRIEATPGNVALATEVDRQGFFSLLNELLDLRGLDPTTV